MPSQKKALILIFSIVLLDLIGFGIVIPLHSFLAREYMADELQVGLLMSIYSLMQFIFAPFWGSVSDRYGRRPILLLSLLGACVAHLGFAYATSYTGLFVARFFAGVFAANISTAMAYVADITPAEKRSQSMGLVGAAIGLGFVLGPFLGGIFGKVGMHFGSSAPFGMSFGAVIASVICFINFLWAYKALPESLPLSQRQKVLKRVSAWGRLKHLYRLSTQSKVGYLLWMYLLATVAMGHMEVAMFLYVDDKFHWTFDQASLGFAYMGLIMAFSQGYLVRKFMPKYGERRLILVGSLLYGVCLLLVGLSSNMIMLGVSVTILAIGIGLTNPSLTGSISLLSSASEQGQMMGISQGLASLGRILGPAIGSLLYKEFFPEAPFYSGAFLLVIVFILALRHFSEIPEKAKKEAA